MELFTPNADGSIHANDRLKEAVGSGRGRGVRDVHFKPHMPITIHGARHLTAEDVGDKVSKRMHRELLAALDSTFSDKD